MRRTSGRTNSASAAALALTLAVALAAGAAGCGSDEQPTANESSDGEVVDISGTEPVGEETAGSVAHLVECRDWTGATNPEKVATIEDVRSQINLEDSGVTAPALSDEEALDVFDDACGPRFAQGFRLYLIYARAIGFKPIHDAIAEGTE